jgi:cytochrome c biogenesis protein CcdA
MVYILLFGLGSVLSMGIMTILIGLPFMVSAQRMPRMNEIIKVGVGALSIVIGVMIMYEMGFKEGLF